MYSVQSTCTAYIVHLLCTLCSGLSWAWFGGMGHWYIVHCTLYIVHCTLYIVHCTCTYTLYILHCTFYMYIVHCIASSDYWVGPSGVETIFSVQSFSCPVLFCIVLYTVLYSSDVSSTVMCPVQFCSTVMCPVSSHRASLPSTGWPRAPTLVHYLLLHCTLLYYFATLLVLWFCRVLACFVFLCLVGLGWVGFFLS